MSSASSSCLIILAILFCSSAQEISQDQPNVQTQQIVEAQEVPAESDFREPLILRPRILTPQMFQFRSPITCRAQCAQLCRPVLGVCDRYNKCVCLNNYVL